MSEHRFDEFSKLVGVRASRRGVLKAALGLAAGGLLSRFGRGAEDVEADHEPAVAPASDAFQRTWARTDQPVALGLANRTWMWGPEAFTDALTEEYADSPGGERTVQYFDKSRMELTYPDLDPADPFYVTNGRLASELITGQMQVGDDDFVERQPAQVNIAGDPGERPTYAEIGQLGLLDAPATAPGTTLTATYADGAIGDDAAYAQYGVTAAEQITVPGLNHTVASVFWEFANQTGPVYADGQTTEARLFDPWFFATGLPITEAYWSRVAVAGTEKDILWQCFEHRCLTYTPDNAPGWQVEAGNVGQHYYEWRTTPQEDLSIVDAPPEVEAELAEVAGDNSHYQLLTAHLETEGFTLVDQGATQASGAGIAPVEFLQVLFETSPPNPLQAVLTFDPGTETALVYAMVITAQNDLLYLLYVDAESTVAVLFPPAGQTDGTVVQRHLEGSLACSECVNECVNSPIRRQEETERSGKSCSDLTFLFCDSLFPESEVDSFPESLARAYVCAATFGQACLKHSLASTCEDVCEPECSRGCELCSGTDPAALCCNDRCTDTTNDANNCGGCNQRCAPGQKCCGGVCLDILSDTANCGACGTSCLEGHDCINGVCTAPSDPCEACLGNDLSNYCCGGVCLDLLNDFNNCGGCGVSCFEGQTCCDGVCLDIMSDDQNCGACGVVCGDEEDCVNGMCVDEPDPCDECVEGEACCGDVCIDVTSDNDNCGDCGIECAAGWACMNGICERLPECEDETDCFGCDICVGGICVDCPGTCCSGGECAPPGTCCPEHIDCGGGLCCGGDFPICCHQYGYCCSNPYPVCCDGNSCCSADFPVCCNDGWCCPAGCHCTGNQSCDCSSNIDVAAETAIGAAAALGSGHAQAEDISYW